MGETSATLTLPSTLATWDRGPLTCGSPSFLAAPAAGPSYLFFFLAQLLLLFVAVYYDGGQRQFLKRFAMKYAESS